MPSFEDKVKILLRREDVLRESFERYKRTHHPSENDITLSDALKKVRARMSPFMQEVLPGADLLSFVYIELKK